MRWRRGVRSAHVEDRRGRRGRRTALGAGGIVVLLVGIFFGPEAARFVDTLSGGGGGQGATSTPAESQSAEDPDAELVDFVNWVHDDLEKVWKEQFARTNTTYAHPTLVLFTEAVSTACGYSSSAIGPFYCPGDNKAYIDLSFYRALARELNAPGDFAQAYVLAHELGHHVQNLLGTSRRVRALQKRNPAKKNELSVLLELQADCYAGIWGHSTARRDLLVEGDIEEGLNAAAAIGDDRLQRRASGTTNPETWTHGSSAERVRWFRRGLKTGDLAACDTFAP